MTSQLRDGLILLLAAGLVSGLVVPLIVNRVQARNQERLKRFEADVARQTKVIDDQVAFVERLADHLWEYQLLLIAPLYYGQPGLYQAQAPGNETYSRSRAMYFDQAGHHLGRIRAEIGKAIRLVPPGLWNELKGLYYEGLLQLDLAVTRLLLAGPSDSNRAEWSSVQGRVLRELAHTIDVTIDRTAEALSLKDTSEHRSPRSPEYPETDPATGQATES